MSFEFQTLFFVFFFDDDGGRDESTDLLWNRNGDGSTHRHVVSDLEDEFPL